MAEEFNIRVNDQDMSVASRRDTPLLYVLAGERLSITMEVSFCIAALEDALACHDKLEIFNRIRAASSPPRLDPVISGFEHWDAVMRAQRCDALPRPSVAMASNKAIPIEDAGDEIVIGDQHQLADSRDHIG
jgi:hypothetical protein